MGEFVLGQRSLKCLEGVHPDLVKVVKRAIEITKQDFSVIEGLRSVARQRQLVAKGASQTMNSRHITGNAVDIVPWINGGVSWDWKFYSEINSAMNTAAGEYKIPVEWGGNWKSFRDGPHYQLPHAQYPAVKAK